MGWPPHRCRQFKISTDPNFARMARDVIGLYLDLPAHALVLSLDEKRQIQALECAQASPPLQPGQPATQTQAKRRQQEFLAFLDTLSAETPAATPVHVILDYYATHKTAAVHAWLATYPHWHFHFTPTSSSWMHAVEGLFAKLARGLACNAATSPPCRRWWIP